MDQERLQDLREGSKLAEDNEVLEVKVKVGIEVEVENEATEVGTWVEVENEATEVGTCVEVKFTLETGGNPLGSGSSTPGSTMRPSIPSTLPKFSINSACGSEESPNCEKSTSDAGVSRSLIPGTNPVVFCE